MFVCDCGAKTNTLKYYDGKRKCDSCSNTNLSGQFERRMIHETHVYAKDILQPYNKDGTKNQDYIEAYGEKIYKNK